MGCSNGCKRNINGIMFPLKTDPYPTSNKRPTPQRMSRPDDPKHT